MSVGDEVAWFLPALGVTGGVAPGRAPELALADQKVEIDGRVVKGKPFAQAVELLEGSVDFTALQEHVAIDRFVAKARRYHNTVDGYLRQQDE